MTTIWDVTFTLGVLAGFTFIIGYGVKARGRWYRYRMGWHLMMTMVALTAALTGLLWESIVGNISTRIWFLMVASIVVSMWHQVYLLFATDRTVNYGRRSTDVK